ncbi:hypothetical protein LPJ72_006103 [Coemansia sp. Benny D160-2]|nr:hypothetical protein LPJ72_006103 [Coemansia sp. Benny D160-2]
MLLDKVLVKVAKQATALPNGVKPSLEHWINYQLPLVQVNQAWRNALIPIVFDTAFITCNEKKDYVEDKFEKMHTVSNPHISNSCKITEMHWQKHVPSQLVVTINAQWDVVNAISKVVEQVEANRFYLRSVKKVYLKITTYDDADSLWSLFSSSQQACDSAHKFAGLLNYLRELNVSVHSKNKNALMFVKTLSDVTKKHLEAFDINTSVSLLNCGYERSSTKAKEIAKEE